MNEETALTEEDLDNYYFAAQRGDLTSTQVLKLVMTIRTQRRVLGHLFDLFKDIDSYGLRQQSDSIRSHNLTALKKEVGMEDKT